MSKSEWVFSNKGRSTWLTLPLLLDTCPNNISWHKKRSGWHQTISLRHEWYFNWWPADSYSRVVANCLNKYSPPTQLWFSLVGTEFSTGQGVDLFLIVNKLVQYIRELMSGLLIIIIFCLEVGPRISSTLVDNGVTVIVGKPKPPNNFDEPLAEVPRSANRNFTTFYSLLSNHKKS